MNNDLSRSVYDGMDGRLREEFNRGEEGSSSVNAAYRILSQKAENAGEVFKPLLSSLLWLTERLRVACAAKVLVRVLRDRVHVSPFKRRTPFAQDEFNLRGLGVF